MDTQTLLKPAEAAAYLGRPPRALESLRYRGGGPRFIRQGRRTIRYRVSDLDDWLAGRTFSTTAEAREAERGR